MEGEIGEGGEEEDANWERRSEGRGVVEGGGGGGVEYWRV